MNINEQVTWKTLGDKIVAVKVETGEYFTMNEVASLIWRGVNEGKDAEAICKQICEEYEVDNSEPVMADVNEQLQEWKTENLISI